MRGFVVVDLFAQAEYVPRGVQTPPERFIAWLRQYAEVGTWPVYKDGQVTKRCMHSAPNTTLRRRSGSTTRESCISNATCPSSEAC
jgi:hypothetical protein